MSRNTMPTTTGVTTIGTMIVIRSARMIRPSRAQNRARHSPMTVSIVTAKNTKRAVVNNEPMNAGSLNAWV